MPRHCRLHMWESAEKHAHAGPDVAEDWEEEIRHHLRSSLVVLGVGSRLRGDDAAGPVVAERLAERGVESAFDCGGVPENFLGKIEALQPADILFVDSVDFDRPAGSIGFFGGQRFDTQSISTHCAGLSPLMDFLAGSCRAACWVLAIQPADLTYGADLSEPVRRAVERIVASPVWSERQG